MTVTPDTPNLSGAILLALRDAGWIGALWARARALRDAGMGKAAIREELGI